MEQNIPVVIGTDISAETIDVCVINQNTTEIILSKNIPNGTIGHKKFIEQIQKYASVSLVMDATGNYHKKFAAQLLISGIRFSIVNPLVLRRYAQMKMLRTKTDKIDARTIALFGLEQKPAEYIVPTTDQEHMKALITVLNSLMKQRTQNKNLIHSQLLLPGGNPQGQKSIKKVLMTINSQIKKIEEEIEKIVKENFNDLYKKITSINGIGGKTANTVIAYLGDLRSFKSYKQVSSFIGISPAIRQSGHSMNKTCGITKQGNPQLRTLFYMAALSAVRSNKKCKELYIRLLQRGKKKKIALIAVANKLIKQLFAIVKNNLVYVDDFIHPKYAMN